MSDDFHDYSPLLSDIRQTLSLASLSSALARRNATRIPRRATQHSFEESARIWRRRQASPISEPAPKRRRTEKLGQTRMERLQMELSHCDGGRYDGAVLPSDYSPGCALRDDTSVYCTKNSKCNMILRHSTGECFAVQRIVIRAPPSGYTDPVSAGMIFVAMEDTDLLSQTEYPAPYEPVFEDEPALIYETLVRPNFLPSIRTTPPPVVSLPSWPPAAEGSAEMLQPNATFRHKHRKSRIVINFDPPISGRYILAKFFSTSERKNIDIEFIGVYGWVGRRFFPARTLR